MSRRPTSLILGSALEYLRWLDQRGQGEGAQQFCGGPLLRADRHFAGLERQAVGRFRSDPPLIECGHAQHSDRRPGRLAQARVGKLARQVRREVWRKALPECEPALVDRAERLAIVSLRGFAIERAFEGDRSPHKLERAALVDVLSAILQSRSPSP